MTVKGYFSPEIRLPYSVRAIYNSCFYILQSSLYFSTRTRPPPTTYLSVYSLYTTTHIHNIMHIVAWVQNPSFLVLTLNVVNLLFQFSYSSSSSIVLVGLSLSSWAYIVICPRLFYCTNWVNSLSLYSPCYKSFN